VAVQARSATQPARRKQKTTTAFENLPPAAKARRGTPCILREKLGYSSAAEEHQGMHHDEMSAEDLHQSQLLRTLANSPRGLEDFPTVAAPEFLRDELQEHPVLPRRLESSARKARTFGMCQRMPRRLEKELRAAWNLWQVHLAEGHHRPRQLLYYPSYPSWPSVSPLWLLQSWLPCRFFQTARHRHRHLPPLAPEVSGQLSASVA